MVKNGDRVWLRDGDKTKVVTANNSDATELCFQSHTVNNHIYNVHIRGVCAIESMVKGRKDYDLWTIEQVEGCFDAET